MTGALHTLEVELPDASDLHVVERQVAGQADPARTFVEVGTAEVGVVAVQPEPQLRPTLGLGEFDVHVVTVDALLQLFDRVVSDGPKDDAVISLGQLLYQLAHDGLP
jgi:hypothetical protein